MERLGAEVIAVFQAVIDRGTKARFSVKVVTLGEERCSKNVTFSRSRLCCSVVLNCFVCVWCRLRSFPTVCQNSAGLKRPSARSKDKKRKVIRVEDAIGKTQNVMGLSQ